MRRNSFSVLSCLVCVGGAMFLGACQSSQKTADARTSAPAASAKAVNTICPVGGDEVSPDVATASYKNQTVAFCCENCAKKWAKMTDQEKDKALASAMTTKQ